MLTGVSHGGVYIASLVLWHVTDPSQPATQRSPESDTHRFETSGLYG